MEEESVSRRGKRLRLKWVVAVIVAVVAVATVLYAVIRPREPHVTVTTVHRQDISNQVFASGDVHPTQRQVVQPNELPSPVQKVSVQVGQQVHQGDILLTCQNKTQLAQLNAAKMAVQQAKDSLNKTQAQVNSSPAFLHSQFAGSLAQLKSSLAQAQAQLATAQAAYDQTMIHAKIAGTVLLLNPDGIAPDGNSAPIIEVVGPGKQVVVSVSEVDAVHVKPGDKATVKSDAYPNQKWQATVTNVALYANSSSNGAGQVEVDLSLPNPCPVPFSYQVNVHITSETHKNALTVPYAALTQVGSQYEVYVLSNHRVVLTKVQLGITTDTDVEVTSGLKAGQDVVLNPPTALPSGGRVVVVGS